MIPWKRINLDSTQKIPRKTLKHMGKTKKIETKIDDIQKLSHENLISQLINSNNHYVNLRSIVFIPMSFEIRDKLI